jgi:hypothetical protein
MMVTSILTVNHSTGNGIVGLLSYILLLYREATYEIPIRDHRMNGTKEGAILLYALFFTPIVGSGQRTCTHNKDCFKMVLAL